MLPNDISRIVPSDIVRLIEEEFAEGLHLEYKEVLPGRSDDEKKEFLADATAFANADGGFIVYGVRERRDGQGQSTGVPEQVVPILGQNLDAEIRRLENVLKDNVQPRLLRVRFRVVNDVAGDDVVVLRIPAAPSGPHVVAFNRSAFRVYSRRSTGKYPLDVDEIRSFFVGTESLSARMQDFQLSRVGRILSGEGVVGIQAAQKVAVHILPREAFARPSSKDVGVLVGRHSEAQPIYCGPGWSSMRNVDGLLFYAPWGEAPRTYVQFFRSGVVEAVAPLSCGRDGRIFGDSLEREVLARTTSYLALLQSIDFTGPVMIILSLLSVRNVRVRRSGPAPFVVAGDEEVHEIGRNEVVLPPAMLDAMDAPLAPAMKLPFDVLWQSSGHAGSPSYDASGNYGAAATA